MHNTLRNIFLIARREYLQRVRTKSFIWTTLLIPGLMIGFTLLPGYFMSMKLTEKKHLTVASDDGDLARAFKERFAGKDKESGAQYEIEVVPVATEGERQKLESDVQDKELDGYLWLTRAALQNGKVEYHVRSTGDFMERERIHSAVNFIAIQRRLAGSGVQGVDVDAILKPVTVDAVQVGHGKSNSDAMLMTALLLVLILYMTVILQGVAVMRSVLEEKTSRVMEVLLSAVTPRELMAGKIIGVGSVGLTQIAIWGAISLAVSFTGIATAAAVTGGGMHLTFTSAFFFVVFYLLGFMLYSSLAAALGAMVNSEEEAQQMQFFVTMPIVFAIMFLWAVIRAPNATFAVVLSLIPFFAPILMYLRVALETPPLWQLGLCVAILLATIYAMLSVCARIYRVGILMYGKRPTLPEIMKWIRYA